MPLSMATLYKNLKKTADSKWVLLIDTVVLFALRVWVCAGSERALRVEQLSVVCYLLSKISLE